MRNTRDARRRKRGELGAVAFEGTNSHDNGSPTGAAPQGRLSNLPVRRRPEDAATSDMILIEDRSLIRECMAYSLKSLFPNRILSFPSIANWLGVADRHSPGAVLLSMRAPARAGDVQQALDMLFNSPKPVPVIIMCDVEDPWQIVDALERGARGYILTSISLDVAAQAMRLVMAGGVFAPASSLIAAHPLIKRAGPAARSGKRLFTARQTAVVGALCRGKTNKDIALELNLCESTVQVHVRNIMKKLNANNRTEVAFIANHLANGTGPALGAEPAASMTEAGLPGGGREAS